MAVPNGYRVTEFRAEGVWVSAPQNLVVSLRPISGFVPEMATQDDFQPIRMLGNLKFQNPAEPDQTVFSFDPPAQLQVRFTGNDASRAQQRKKSLALAWWDGREWRRVPDGPTFFDEEVSSGGYVGFILTEISDPPICWGT